MRSRRFVGEGWDSRVYVVNDKLVFRFPKRSSHRAELHREIAFPVLRPAEADALLARLERYVDAPDGLAFQPAVLHADFGREHVLTANRTVGGVVDFGDVNRGDPDYDFTYLLLDLGPAFVEATAARYGHPDRERLRRKIHYFALVDQVDRIVHGASLASPDQQRDAWSRVGRLLRGGVGV